jgi:DNA-binding XRE family transcriptional regulator
MRSARAEARSTSTKPLRAQGRAANNVRLLREEQLLTKAELARKAGISALTLARIEGGRACRVDTKRKIIFALGLGPADRDKVFGHRDAHAVRKGR